MTQSKISDGVATTLLGLATIVGIFAAGALFTPRVKQPAKTGPGPTPPVPRKTAANPPIVLAPGRGVLDGKDLHRLQRALRSLQGPIDVIIDVYGGYVMGRGGL